MGYVSDKAVVNVDCLQGVVEYIVEEDKATSRHSRKGNSAEESSNQIISILIDCSISRLPTVQYLGLTIAALPWGPWARKVLVGAVGLRGAAE
jgi:hypothetical protein